MEALAALITRDQSSDGSGSSSSLSTGAIIGIICGVAGLFIVGAILLLVYCLRQRNYDLEDQRRSYFAADYWGRNRWQDTREDHYPTTTDPICPPTKYTTDHKMDEEVGTNSGSHSPGTSKSSKTAVSLDEVMNDCMPTHPAYVPRALVRATAPQQQRSGTPATIDTAASSVTVRPRAESDADNFSLQVYLKTVDDQIPAPAAQNQRPQRREASPHVAMPAYQPAPASTKPARPQWREVSPHVAMRAHQPAPATTTTVRPQWREVSPHVALPAYPAATATITTTRPPQMPLSYHRAREVSPPRRADVPITGLEEVTISGVLAFPRQTTTMEENIYYDDYPQTFRDRAPGANGRPVANSRVKRWTGTYRTSMDEVVEPPPYLRRPSFSEESDGGVYG